MKTSSLLIAVVVSGASLLLQAQPSPWQRGKILSVERHTQEPLCCYGGTDGPLQSEVVDYDIAFQVRGVTYVGEYETWAYVPRAWVKDHVVDLRTNKHFIYLKAPSGEEMRLLLLSHKRMDHMPK